MQFSGDLGQRRCSGQLPPIYVTPPILSSAIVFLVDPSKIFAHKMGLNVREVVHDLRHNVWWKLRDVGVHAPALLLPENEIGRAGYQSSCPSGSVTAVANDKASSPVERVGVQHPLHGK